MKRVVYLISLSLCCACLIGQTSQFSFSEQKKLGDSLTISKNYNEIKGLIQAIKQYSRLYEAIPLYSPVSDKKGYAISSDFGNRIDPISKTNSFHRGIDFAAGYRTEVYATMRGRVSFVGQMGNLGLCVVVTNQYGFKTIYAHLSGHYTRKGAYVLQGTKIGFVGSTGRSTGNHLHYEIHKNDQVQNPNDYLKAEEQLEADTVIVNP